MTPASSTANRIDRFNRLVCECGGRPTADGRFRTGINRIIVLRTNAPTRNKYRRSSRRMTDITCDLRKFILKRMFIIGTNGTCTNATT